MERADGSIFSIPFSMDERCALGELVDTTKAVADPSDHWKASGLRARRGDLTYGNGAVDEFLCLVQGGAKLLCHRSIADELAVPGYGDLPSDHERLLFEVISAIAHSVL